MAVPQEGFLSLTHGLTFIGFLSEAVLVTVTRISDRRIAAKAFVSINSGGLPLKPEEIVDMLDWPLERAKRAFEP